MHPTLLTDSTLANCFTADYAEAHARFRQACDRHEHSRYQDFVYTQTGPNDEKLSTAVCWLGNSHAKRVLVIQSGVHGVEGFAGSAIQIDCLDWLSQSKLNDELAILFIHSLNPYGFAWLRRVNEQGVDLNRNFIDFDTDLPKNTDYSALADWLVPQDSSNIAEADQQLAQRQQGWGQTRYEQAVSGGQYAFADGLFYGGRQASQAQKHLASLFNEFQLGQRQEVIVIDIHTGLGPYAYGELICDHLPHSVGATRARRVFGHSVTEPALGNSSSVPKWGLVDYYWQRQLADRVCFVTLEFGTFAVSEMFRILREDHMLHRNQVDWHKPAVQTIKQAMRKHFYPATADWQEMVLLRGRQVIKQAMQALAQDTANE